MVIFHPTATSNFSTQIDSNFQLSNSPLPTLGRHSQQLPISPATERKIKILARRGFSADAPHGRCWKREPQQGERRSKMRKRYRNDTLRQDASSKSCLTSIFCGVHDFEAAIFSERCGFGAQVHCMGLKSHHLNHALLH